MIRIILFILLLIMLIGLILLGDTALTWELLKFLAYCITMSCILAGLYLLIPFLKRD
jgi:hypothetical protein